MEKLIVIDGRCTNYVVSDTGHVYSCLTGQEIKYYTASSGYLNFYCNAVDGYKFGMIQLHRIVALAFVPNPDPEINTTVDHIDGNKLNNAASNLEWVSQGENNRRAYANNLHKPLKAEQVIFTKYTREQVTKACELLQEGLAPLVVAEKTGIEVKNLYDIRNGRLWKDVTCNYTFPKSKYPRSSLYEPELREKVEELIMQGVPSAKIRDDLNIPHLYKHIQDWKYRLMKAQRLEKGSEN